MAIRCRRVRVERSLPSPRFVILRWWWRSRRLLRRRRASRPARLVNGLDDRPRHRHRQPERPCCRLHRQECAHVAPPPPPTSRSVRRSRDLVRGRVGERRTTLNDVAPLPPARLSGVSCAHRWPAFNNRQRRILPAIPPRVASGGTPKALYLTNRNGVPRTVRPSILATWSCGPQHRACGWSRLPAGSVAVFACDPRIGDGRGRSAATSFIRCLRPTVRGREASPRRSRFTAGCIFNLVRLRRTMDARSWLMRRDHRPSPIAGEEHRTEGAAP